MINSKEYIHVENLDDLKCNDLYSLLHQILRYVKDITSAEAGSIYLLDGKHLKFSIFQNDAFSYEKIDEVQKPLSDLKFELKEKSGTLAVESFIMNKMINIDDIYQNDDFNFTSAKKFDEKFGYKTTSILTAPLVNYFNDTRIGVLQLVNKQDNSGRYISFDTKDKEALSLTSHLITLSINAVQESEEEIKKITESIDRKVAIRTQDMKKVQDKLKSQAYTDPLTGLFNRRYFNEITSDIVKNKRLSEKQGAIFILDIDNFKIINDTH
ncbi:MAG TPA: diguanylate cyclase, partial [Arcobacter sp.]|nr:diguanylate cyclase [Arcobacter sp.]